MQCSQTIRKMADDRREGSQMEENRENITPENEGEKNNTEESETQENTVQNEEEKPAEETAQIKEAAESAQTAQQETVKAAPKNKAMSFEMPERKHGGWKTAGKVIGVIAIVFAASFGGTMAAMKWMEKRMSTAFNDQIEDIFGNMPNGYDGKDFYDFDFDYDSQNDSQQKTNSNSAGLGIYIRSDSDQAVIYAFTPDSLADDAGLQEGDIIISINGEDTDDYDDVVEELEHFNPGDVVRVGFMRDGEKMTTDVELIDRNSPNSDFPYAGKGQIQ